MIIQRYKLAIAQLLCIFCSFVTFSAGAQVVANFVADNQAGCAPLIVHFTNTSTGATAYTWNLGTGTSAQTNASASYLSPGTYTITLTATNGSASSTKTLTITVYGVPQVAFTAPNSVCANTPVSFINQTTAGVPGPVTYSWNFGDGGTSVAQNPIHTYTAAGVYNITLLATNSQGCDSLLIKTAYITVVSAPVAAFTVNNSHFCSAPAAAVFTDQTTGASPFTYTWNFGDNGTGSSGIAPHTYQSTGTYNVTEIVTDVNGCKDTLTKPAYVAIGGPHASFSPPTGCAFGTVNFTSTSTPGNAQATWNFGDGIFAAGNPAIHVYAAGGTYNVTLVVNDGGCIDSTTRQVTINPNPAYTVSFNPNPPACSLPAPLTFSTTAPAGSTYSWSFSDGGSSQQANPVHNVLSYGQDTAILTVTSSAGCQTTTKTGYAVYDMHAVVNAINTLGCIPLTTSFFEHDSTTIPTPLPAFPYNDASYTWNFGDGSPVSNQHNPQHVYTTVGSFTAYVTVITTNGCTGVDSVHIATGAIPQVAMTASINHICSDRDVYFHSTPVNGALYTWLFGDISGPESNYNDSVTMHKYPFPGIDTPKVIVSVNGCKDTVSNFNIVITVDSPKSIYHPFYFCDTLTKVVFVNTSVATNATTYTWFFGDGTPTSNIKAPTHQYPALGSYSTELVTYDPVSGCHDTAYAYVNLHTIIPSFTASDTAVCIKMPFTVTGTVTGGTTSGFSWFVDGSFFTGGPGNTFIDSFTTKGRHSIMLTVADDHGCKDTAIRSNYILVAKPVDSFYFAPVTGCIPLTVNFTDSSRDVAGATIASRTWFWGDGGSQPNGGKTAAHTYTTGGTFYPKETIIDNVGCKDTLVSPNPVTVTKPTAAFSASTLFPCRNIPMSFTNTV